MTIDRVFLDANVLLSAAYRPNAGIARLWKFKNAELLTSGYAAEEARVNLSEREQQQRSAKLLKTVRIVTELSSLPREVSLPEKDRPILQAALHARATHLLTGDQQPLASTLVDALEVS